jgi:DNA-binding GntR family transcriptional regulator
LGRETRYYRFSVCPPGHEPGIDKRTSLDMAQSGGSQGIDKADFLLSRNWARLDLKTFSRPFFVDFHVGRQLSHGLYPPCIPGRHWGTISQRCRKDVPPVCFSFLVAVLTLVALTFYVVSAGWRHSMADARDILGGPRIVKGGPGKTGGADEQAGEFALPVVIGEALSRTLADKIIFLVLPPGAHLTEEGVCVEYAVSRSPVREAFRSLESDGLVTRLTRRGVRVSAMGRKDVENVYACRIALEGLAAREAARNATDQEIANLWALRDEMARAMKRRELRSFFDSNVNLSHAILAACANPSLQRIAVGIEKQALRYRYLAHTRSRQMAEKALQGHTEVVGAIAARKPAFAERMAQQSLRRNLSEILDVIEDFLAAKTPTADRS